MHVEDLEQQVRLVAHALLQTFVLGAFKVVAQDGLVLRVGALLDDHAGALAWREATDVCETLWYARTHTRKCQLADLLGFPSPLSSSLSNRGDKKLVGRGFGDHHWTYLLGHDDVEIVLCLVDVRAHGHDAADAVRVRLARPRARRVHDAVLGAAQEVGTPAQPVQHPAAHDAGAVGVGVDVDFDGRVHADDAEPADDLGRVGDLLRAEEELGVVVLPL